MFPAGVKKYFSSNKDLYPSGGIPISDKIETHAKGANFAKAHKTAMNKVGS